MVHYKVSLDVWRRAGFNEDAFHTFCGLDIRTSPSMEFLHFLGEDEQEVKQAPVDCPRCRVLYDTVVNNFLKDKNP